MHEKVMHVCDAQDGVPDGFWMIHAGASLTCPR